MVGCQSVVTVFALLIFVLALAWCGYIWKTLADAVLGDSPNFVKLIHAHPALMTAGFVLCMSSGFLAYCTSFSRPVQVKLHVAFQFLAVIFVTAGFGAAGKSKQLQGHEHITTGHSIVGLLAILLVWFQFLTGLVKSMGKKNAFLKTHGGTGIFAFMCGICAIFIALNGMQSSTLGLGTYQTIMGDASKLSRMQALNGSLILITGFTVFFFINFKNKHTGADDPLTGPSA